MRVSVIQLNASDDKRSNLARVTELVETAVRADAADLVILPEMSSCISGSPDMLHHNAEPIEGGEWGRDLSALARRLSINLHSGSMIEKRGDAYYNTSVLYGRRGQILGRYSKIHRFDVILPDGTAIQESAVVERGDSVEVVEVEGVKLGFAICYDLRFPELFRKLADAGADLIAIPSAFTFQTGSDHWEVLLRARAIETQCYVAAPGQSGLFDKGKYMNFGHSMIVDPWGLVVAQASNREGHASAALDLAHMAAVRTRLPIRSHYVLS